MRITLQHDAASPFVLDVLANANRELLAEIPPGKARTVEVDGALLVRPGRAFPGWDAWTAEHSAPASPSDSSLPPIGGRS